MALYQPTNITPSTFAGIGGGVVDVNDRISLSFQVNGNSEMTGWTVTVYTNNAASTQVTQFSIGRDGTPISFFGTDERGNVNMYEYTAPTSTWSAWNLTNGNSYKMKLTLYWTENGVEKNVSTQSDSVFITRAAPTLSISPAAGTLTSVTQDFTAAFAQAQGDAVSWVRWVLTDDTAGKVIEDTGTLYTGLLAYSYNGFFSGKNYSLSCTVETSSGVTKTVTNTYAVSYTVPEQTGGVTATCNADDSVTLSWTAGRDIPGVPSAEDYGSILDGVLHLAASRSITWNEVNGESMAMASPYCFAWKGKIAEAVSENVTVNSGTWEPNETRTDLASTTGTKTITSDMWVQNPNVPATAWSTKFATISVTTAQGTSYRGSITVAPDADDTNITDPVILDKGSLTTASIVYNGTNFIISGTAQSSGSYTVTYRYTRDTIMDNKYMAKVDGTLSVPDATLYAIAITSINNAYSAIGTVGKNASGQSVPNSYTITVYASTNINTATVSFLLGYKTETILNYKSVVTGTKAGASGISVYSTTADSATATINVYGNYTVTFVNDTQTSCSAVVTFSSTDYPDLADLISVSDGENTAKLDIFGYGQMFELYINDDLAAAAFIPEYAWYAAVFVSTNGKMNVAYFDANGEYLSSRSSAIDPDSGDLPSPVTSVTISGAQECDYVYVSKNADYFSEVGYTPDWNSSTLLFADFVSDLQGGSTGNIVIRAAAIYRNDGETLHFIGTFDEDITILRDYGIRSGRQYVYDMYYVTEGEYSAGAESSPICRQFHQHTLIEAEEDATLSNVYHPVHVWRFGDNLDAGAYSNQNSPVLLQNFTKYPLWQPSSQASRSGTLVALLGKLESGAYSGDNAAAMDALFALSESVNPLFYRDMKGNLYMVRLAGPITQTINNRTGVLEVSVSVPWVEVGDATDAKIYAEA